MTTLARTMSWYGLMVMIIGVVFVASSAQTDRMPMGEPVPWQFDPEQPSRCAQQMEAAMWAMEPYTVIGKRFYVQKSGTEKTLNIVIADQPPTLFEAAEQWSTAKRDCWREP